MLTLKRIATGETIERLDEVRAIFHGEQVVFYDVALWAANAHPSAVSRDIPIMSARYVKARGFEIGEATDRKIKTDGRYNAPFNPATFGMEIVDV